MFHRLEGCCLPISPNGKIDRSVYLLVGHYEPNIPSTGSPWVSACAAHCIRVFAHNRGPAPATWGQQESQAAADYRKLEANRSSKGNLGLRPRCHQRSCCIRVEPRGIPEAAPGFHRAGSVSRRGGLCAQRYRRAARSSAGETHWPQVPEWNPRSVEYERRLRDTLAQPAGWSERVAATILWDESDIAVGCPPSLTLIVRCLYEDSHSHVGTSPCSTARRPRFSNRYGGVLRSR